MKTCPQCGRFEEIQVEIAGMNKVNKEGSSLKAFFDVNLREKPDTEPLTIYGLKLMDGRDGNMWASWPSREYIDKQGAKKWQSIVRNEDKALMERITEAARGVHSGAAPSKSKPKEEIIPF